MADTDRIAGYHDLYWLPTTTGTGSILGGTGPEGLEVEEEVNLQEITGDALGPRTVVDWVYQGGNVFLNFVLQDLKLESVKKFLNPWSQAAEGTPTFGEFIMGTPGEIASQTTNIGMGWLIAIPRTGTPAAAYMASGNQGFKFKGICIGPRRRSFDTRHRVVPVRFQCVPYDTDGSGTIGWASMVTSAVVS